MAREQFEADYVAGVEDSISKSKRSADRARIGYIVLRIILVVSTALVPALVVSSHTNWATAISVVVAIATGLDTQFPLGEEWRHFRSTQMGFDRLLREYEYRNAVIQSGGKVGAIANAEDNFEEFVADVESLRLAETGSFFRFRIKEAKSTGSRKG